MTSNRCQYKQAVNTATTNTCYGNGTTTSSQFSTLYTQTRNTSMHKSFDLSDVALDGTGKNGAYRQFHQTRIFVQEFGGMMNHGKKVGSGTFLLTANLPDSFSYSVGSTWEQPLNDLFPASAKLNLLTQVLGASTPLGDWTDIYSANNRLTTIQAWKNSNELSINITVPVVDDSHYCTCTDRKAVTNFTEALEFLSCLCLPQLPDKAHGFYVPPPSPLRGNIIWSNAKEEADEQGNITKTEEKKWSFNPTYGRITLQLGGMFILDNCILKKVTVQYNNTKALIRKLDHSTGKIRLVPLYATVTMEFGTIQAIDANNFSKMIWVEAQEEAGKFTASIPDIVKGATELGKSALNGIFG